MTATWDLPAATALTDRLGWMLCHSLWQFAAVALVLALLLRLFRTPQVRYVLGCGALLTKVVLAVVTFALLRPGPVVNGALHATTIPADVSDQDEPTRAATTPTESSFEVATSGSVLGLTRHVRAWRSRAGDAVRPWLPWIVAAWCLGVCGLSLRPICGWRTLRRLRRDGLSAATAEMAAALQRVVRRLGVARPVRIARSSLIQVPLVVGYLRPLILLPLSAASGLSARQLEAVLAHELAHVRRHDFLVNCIQTVIESVFFYHPAVWWISHRVRDAREDCCDDVAVALCEDRVGYARVLIALEELRGPGSAAALAASGGSIVGRVRRIVGATLPERSRPSGMIAAAVLLLSAALTLAAASWLPAAPTPDGEEPRTGSPAKGSDPVATTDAAEPPIPAPAPAPAKPPANWFRPNPFPELGVIDNAGPGWQFVRLASGGRSSAVVGIDPGTRQRLQGLYTATLKDDARLVAQLRSEGRFDARTWTAVRTDHWNEARLIAAAWISPRQAEQIEQLMIQQLGYHAFVGDDLAAQLELSPRQRGQIAARIREHHARIAANHAARDREIAALESDPGAATPERLRQVRAETVQAGIASHRRAWNDIYAALTPRQREQFEEMRGPAVTLERDNRQPAVADSR